MTFEIEKPLDPYAPGWAAWYAANPHVLRSVGAAGDDNDDDGGGDGGEGGGEGEGDGKSGGQDDGGSDDDGKGGRKADGLLGSGADDDAGDEDGKGKGEGEHERPEHIPEKFWNAETGEADTEGLAKAYKTLEAAHAKLKNSKGGDAPEKADEYLADGFDVPEGAENIQLENGVDDPGLQMWADVAHKYGLPKDVMIGIAQDFMKGMNDHTPPPIDIEAEKEKLGKNAGPMIQGMKTWIDGLEAAGKFSQDEADFLYLFGQNAAGISVLSKLRSMTGEKPLPIEGSIEGVGMSAEQWYSEMREAINKGDNKRRAELDEMGKEIFGQQSAGSSIPGIGLPAN